MNMGAISDTIIAFMSQVTLPLQLILIGFFSFTEGLPIIGSILPGGTIALFAGSLSATGVLPPLITSLIVSSMSFFGEMTGFFIMRKYRHAPWIQRMVTHEKYQKSWDLFDRHLAIIAIFGKLIPFVRSTPSLFAAAKGVRMKRYVYYSAAGSILWGFMGVYGGNALTVVFGKKILVVLAIVLLVSLGIGFIRLLFHKLKKKKDEDIQ
jgi:membrane-associated protein